MAGNIRACFTEKSRFTVKQEAGVSRTRKLFETTAVNAANLAAGLHGLMTNPSGKWFSLSVPKYKDVPEVTDWIVQAEQVIADEIVRPCAGFATNIHEVYLDLAVLGTAGLYVGWSEENEGLLFQSRFLGELFLEENAAGQVNQVYRVFKMSLDKIVQTWGRDVLPEKLQAVFESETGRNVNTKSFMP